MSSGLGLDRMLGRLHAQADALTVPTLPEEADTPSRLDFARACGFDDDRPLDPWQIRVLTSTSRKQILNCTRQAGKSTTTGILGLHEAVYTPGALALILCPSQRQSTELGRTIKNLHSSCSLDLPDIVSDSVTRLELENGSRVIALPGSEATTPGYPAATMVIVDEAARVPDHLIASVFPSLATTNGAQLLLSTPAGKRGVFYQTWQNAEEWGWERTLITAYDVPRITPEFLEDQRRLLGEFTFAAEYLCEFQDEETSVFSSDLIERALSGNLEPLWPKGSQAWIW